jgi:parallel beta-helix repeat protein
LDCQNNVIDGDGTGHGIILNGVDDSTISSCTVQEFDNGIRLSSSSDNVLSDNTMNSNGGTSIHLGSDSTYNLITQNEATGSFIGISLNSSSDNTINENELDCNWGIHLNDQSNNNTVIKNTATGNSRGIQIEASSELNNISWNSVESNQFGISLESPRNTVVGNSAGNAGTAGIYVTSDHNHLEDNSANGGHMGIGVLGLNNTVEGNTASNNGQYGIHLSGATENTIIENIL